jgi:hypothetical protein
MSNSGSFLSQLPVLCSRHRRAGSASGQSADRAAGLVQSPDEVTLYIEAVLDPGDPQQAGA